MTPKEIREVLNNYTIVVYCGICGERVGFVKDGSDRVDMICENCGEVIK